MAKNWDIQAYMYNWYDIVCDFESSNGRYVPNLYFGNLKNQIWDNLANSSELIDKSGIKELNF